MEEIRIIEKPDWISWEEIAECIHIGQATNNKKGFDMSFGHFTAEELKQAVKGYKGEGYTFVALDEHNKVVGTESLRIDYVRRWWHIGRCGYRCEAAILPEYRGTDVYFNLIKKIEEKEKSLGITVIWGSTSEKNKEVIKMHKKLGWRFVMYSPSPLQNDYYSYQFVKWKNGSPHKDWWINFMFNLSKLVIPFFYKFDGTKKVNRLTYCFHK